ncbi:MAG: hypothetical protein GF410_13840 [Chitinivibrionales bacterium]|nr:hypothetical protein [Chitinivibrionales bacterium]
MAATSSIRYSVFSTTGRLHIRGAHASYGFTLLSMGGRQLTRTTLRSVSDVRTAGYAPGTYIARMQTSEGATNARVCIQN